MQDEHFPLMIETSQIHPAPGFCPPQQDEESPGPSPPGSPPAFPDDELESGQHFRRRAHTFSHPPVRKRISFEGQPSNQSKQAPVRRQQSITPELLQGRCGDFTWSRGSSHSSVLVVLSRSCRGSFLLDELDLDVFNDKLCFL